MSQTAARELLPHQERAEQPVEKQLISTTGPNFIPAKAAAGAPRITRLDLNNRTERHSREGGNPAEITDRDDMEPRPPAFVGTGFAGITRTISTVC